MSRYYWPPTLKGLPWLNVNFHKANIHENLSCLPGYRTGRDLLTYLTVPNAFLLDSVVLLCEWGSKHTVQLVPEECISKTRSW